MKIVIRKKNDVVTVRESRDCRDADVINAYAAALAMKCLSMFKGKEAALDLLEKAYEFSKKAIEENRS